MRYYRYIFRMIPTFLFLLLVGCADNKNTIPYTQPQQMQATIHESTSETIQASEDPEREWNGRTITLAPNRPHLTEGIEILNVEECLSDFSLLITFANNREEPFSFVQDYALDVKIENQWYEYAAYDSFYEKYLDYTLEPGKTKTMDYELWMYSDLPKGEYRITSHEGISGEFTIDKPKEYDLHATGKYLERLPDEIYQSMTEACSEYESMMNFANQYIFEKRGFHDIFYMYFMEDNRFGYCEGSSSSYLGSGCWTIENGELIMKDDGDNICNYFRIENNVLIYEAEKSTGYIYAVVLDGERFICDRALWEEATKVNYEQELLYYSFSQE